MFSKRSFLLGAASLLWALTSSPASAGNLVQNAGFTSYAGSGLNYQLSGSYTQLNDWTVDGGLNFVVGPGWTGNPNPHDGNTLGAWGEYGQFNIWTTLPGGSSNGFTDAPGGVNYIVADGASTYQGAISQAIGGLAGGQRYTVSFDWATGQQSGFNGQTTAKGWEVGLGSQTQTTPLVTDVSQGFSGLHGGVVDLAGSTTTRDPTSGWFHTTMTFTAGGSSQVLSFLAQGEPDGFPPFVMLANVDMEAVPEPSALVMMGFGAGCLAALRLRGRKAG